MRPASMVVLPHADFQHGIPVILVRHASPLPWLIQVALGMRHGVIIN